MLRKKLILICTALVLGLFSSGAFAAMTPRQAIFQYAHRGDVEGLQRLKSAGYDIDMVDKNGKSVLCSAVSLKDVKAYNTLVKAGANTKHKCVDEISPSQKKSFCARPGATGSAVCPTRAAAGTGAAAAGGAAAGGAAAGETALISGGTLATVGSVAAAGGIAVLVATASHGGGGSGKGKDIKSCPTDDDGNECSGPEHGTCDPKTGLCSCKDGWTGDICETEAKKSCPSATDGICSGNGTCQPDFTCACNPGYFGKDCSTWGGCPVNKDTGSVCSGNGTCNYDPKASPTGSCACNEFYYGHDCSTDIRTKIDCGKHGTAKGKFDEGNVLIAYCECAEGWAGVYCEINDLCYDANCGKHGTCNPSTGRCSCTDGFTPSDASEKDCKIPPEYVVEDIISLSADDPYMYGDKVVNGIYTLPIESTGDGEVEVGDAVIINVAGTEKELTITSIDEGIGVYEFKDPGNNVYKGLKKVVTDDVTGDKTTTFILIDPIPEIVTVNVGGTEKELTIISAGDPVAGTNYVFQDADENVYNGIPMKSFDAQGNLVLFFNITGLDPEGVCASDPIVPYESGPFSDIAYTWNGKNYTVREIAANGDHITSSAARTVKGIDTAQAVGLWANGVGDGGLSASGAVVYLVHASSMTNTGTITATEDSTTNKGVIAMKATSAGTIENSGVNKDNPAIINLTAVSPSVSIAMDVGRITENFANRGANIINGKYSIINLNAYNEALSVWGIYAPDRNVKNYGEININLSNKSDMNVTYPFVMDRNLVRGITGETAVNRGTINAQTVNSDYTDPLKGPSGYSEVRLIEASAGGAAVNDILNGVPGVINLDLTGMHYNVYALYTTPDSAQEKQDTSVGIGVETDDGNNNAGDSGKTSTVAQKQGTLALNNGTINVMGTLENDTGDGNYSGIAKHVYIMGSGEGVSTLVNEGTINICTPAKEATSTTPASPAVPLDVSNGGIFAVMSGARGSAENNGVINMLFDSSGNTDTFTGSAILMTGDENGNATAENNGIISVVFKKAGDTTEKPTFSPYSSFVAMRGDGTGKIKQTNNGVISIDSYADGIRVGAITSDGASTNGKDGSIYITVRGKSSIIDTIRAATQNAEDNTFINEGKIVLTHDGGNGDIFGVGGTNTGSVYLRGLDMSRTTYGPKYISSLDKMIDTRIATISLAADPSAGKFIPTIADVDWHVVVDTTGPTITYKVYDDKNRFVGNVDVDTGELSDLSEKYVDYEGYKVAVWYRANPLNTYTTSTTAGGEEGSGRGLYDIELTGRTRGYALGFGYRNDSDDVGENVINITATNLTKESEDDIKTKNGTSLIVDGLTAIRKDIGGGSLDYTNNMTLNVKGMKDNATYVNGMVGVAMDVINDGVIKINADLSESNAHQIIGMRSHDDRGELHDKAAYHKAFEHVTYSAINNGTIEINAYGKHATETTKSFLPGNLELLLDREDPNDLDMYAYETEYFTAADENGETKFEKLDHLYITDMRGVYDTDPVTYFPDVIGMATNSLAENYGTISINIQNDLTSGDSGTLTSGDSGTAARAVGMMAYDGGSIRNYGTISFTGNAANFIPFYAVGSRVVWLSDPDEDMYGAYERVYATVYNRGTILINGTSGGSSNPSIQPEVSEYDRTYLYSYVNEAGQPVGDHYYTKASTATNRKEVVLFHGDTYEKADTQNYFNENLLSVIVGGATNYEIAKTNTYTNTDGQVIVVANNTTEEKQYAYSTVGMEDYKKTIGSEDKFAFVTAGSYSEDIAKFYTDALIWNPATHKYVSDETKHIVLGGLTYAADQTRHYLDADTKTTEYIIVEGAGYKEYTATTASIEGQAKEYYNAQGVAAYVVANVYDGEVIKTEVYEATNTKRYLDAGDSSVEYIVANGTEYLKNNTKKYLDVNTSNQYVVAGGIEYKADQVKRYHNAANTEHYVVANGTTFLASQTANYFDGVGTDKKQYVVVGHKEFTIDQTNIDPDATEITEDFEAGGVTYAANEAKIYYNNTGDKYVIIGGASYDSSKTKEYISDNDGNKYVVAYGTEYLAENTNNYRGESSSAEAGTIEYVVANGNQYTPGQTKEYLDINDKNIVYVVAGGSKYDPSIAKEYYGQGGQEAGKKYVVVNGLEYLSSQIKKYSDDTEDARMYFVVNEGATEYLASETGRYTDADNKQYVVVGGDGYAEDAVNAYKGIYKEIIVDGKSYLETETANYFDNTDKEYVIANGDEFPTKEEETASALDPSSLIQSDESGFFLSDYSDEEKGLKWARLIYKNSGNQDITIGVDYYDVEEDLAENEYDDEQSTIIGKNKHYNHVDTVKELVVNRTIVVPTAYLNGTTEESTEEESGSSGSSGSSVSSVASVVPLKINEGIEFVSEKDGSLVANGYHLLGDVTAGTSLVQGGNSDTYIGNGTGAGAFVGDGDYSDMSLVSASPLFDASYAVNENNSNGIDIVMTRKSFDQVVENDSLANFLERNYVAGNNEEFFNKLKAFESVADLNKGLNDLMGKETLSRFNFEDMTMMRELNFDMNQNLFHNSSKQFALSGFVRPMAFKGDVSSNGQYSLYNAHTGKLSLGFGVAFTNINSDDAHGDNTRRDATYQFITPIGYQTHGFNLITSPRMGYARGNYNRKGFEDKTYKGTIEKRIYGLTNEARYPLSVGEWTLEPAAEFNVLGYTQRGSEDEKEYSLNIKSQSTCSVEAGVGLYLRKEKELSKDSKLKVNVGVAAYHEFADPYKLDVGMDGMDGHFTLRDENRSDNRGVIRSGFDYVTGPYTFYGSMVTYIDREWRANAKTGIRWNF